MGAGLVALAIAAATAAALAGAGGEAWAQAAVTYTAHVTSATTTVLTFNGPIMVGGSAVTTATDIDESEWGVFDGIVLDRDNLPDSANNPRNIDSMEVTRAGSSPQITVTHANALSQPWNLVKHTRGSPPSLAGVSEDPVLSTTDYLTFTAEVRDNAQVLITFNTDVTAVADAPANAAEFTHPQELNPQFVVHTLQSRDDNAMISTLFATAVEDSLATRQATVTFGTPTAGGLLTSTPLITYTKPSNTEEAYQNTLAHIINNTFAYATDNASPVAFAEFADSDTIRVRFSEEMATPSASDLSGVTVTVTAGGGDLKSGSPTFTPHTDPTSSEPFVPPELTIELAAPAAQDTEHTITFPAGVRAAGGPDGKRAVSAATATLTDTEAPTFVVHKLSNTRLMVTFSEGVRQVSGTTPSLDDWEINTTPGAAATNVSPTGVMLGHNFADLAIAEVGDAVLPTVRYVEDTPTIEDLAGNALGVTPEAAAVAAVDAPIPLSAAHARAFSGDSRVTVEFSEPVIGTTSAADWSVSGASSVTVAPAGAIAAGSGVRTVELTGFELDGGAAPDVEYMGTGLTRDGTSSPPAVATRAVRAADDVPPMVASARTASATAVQVTISEALASPGPASAWRAAFGADERAVEAVTHSGATVTLRVAAGDAWGTSEAPVIRYYRPSTGGAEDLNGAQMATQAFTRTQDGAPPAMAAEVTGTNEITVAFSEALSADPTRTGITWSVATAAAPGTPLALAASAPLSYTAASGGAPATVTIGMAAALGAAAHVVTVTSTESARIDGASGGQVPLSATVDVPETPVPTFTAAMESLTTLALEFNTRVSHTVAALDASDWAVDPDGADDSDTSDDITVESATLSDGGRRLVLVLDGNDAEIGDTSKTPHVAYTAGLGSEELANARGVALATGTEAVAADRAPPRATAASFTGESEIEVTLSEAVGPAHVDQTTVYPSLGGLDVSLSGTTLTIGGAVPAADGATYLVRVPPLVADLACAGATDPCAPNPFTDEVVSATHDDTHAPTFVDGSAHFPTASLLVFRTSEPLDPDTLAGITVAPSLGTLTVAQAGLEVRVSFTATPASGTTYTIGIAGTVTDRADPPNRFEGIAEGATHTETIVYAADTTAPTVDSAALTAADEITVTFSEPVSGTMSTGDWAVYRAEPNFLTSAGVLTENTRISTLQAVSAPGHARAASVTIPAASPVTQASVHFLSQPTDAGMFVGYRGSSLQDRASNALTTHPQATNSVATTDMAGPEPFRVSVNPVPPRQRQADNGDISNFPVGNSLIVRPGDMVRFTVVWSATDFVQDPSLTPAQYRERLTGTTVSYFGGEPVAMERTGDEETVHTLTVPAGAPEGPFRPVFTASDDHGNVRSSTSAFKEGYCDTSLAPTTMITEQGNECAYNPTTFAQDLRRLDRIYPTVDSTPPSPVSARALSPTETLVTFGEPVRHLGGTQAQRAAHWSVSHGSAPTAAAVSGAADGGQSPRAGDPGDYLVTLTHAPVPAGAERTVSYSTGDAAARIVDRVGHEAAAFGPLDVAVGAYTSVAVLDGGSDARGGAYARHANLNDRITVTAVFMDDVATSGAGAPTITVNSDSGSPATPMTEDTSDNTRRTWTHSFEVATGDMEGALEFDIAAQDTMATPNTVEADEGTVQNGNAIIDLTAPAAVSASFASLAPPGVVNVEFSEDVMVPAGGWSLRAAVAGQPGLPVTAASREPGMMDTARLTTTRATPGVPYTVGVPAALADLAGNAYDASAPGPVATYPVEVVTATVEDGPSPFTARTGENARYASLGDQITVYAEFSEDVSGAPRITVASDVGSSATDMGNAGDTNDRTWSHAFTVAAGDMEGGLEFDIVAEVTSGVPGSVTVTEASVRANAIIDLTAPTVSSASFADATTVEVEFGEAVVVPSAGWAVRTIPSGAGDLTVSSAGPKEGEPETAVLTVSGATDTTEYRITIPATLTDLAGNAYDTTVTHDATYDEPGPITYTAHVTSRTTTVLTFSAPLTDGSGAAVTTSTDIDEGEWRVLRNTVPDRSTSPSPERFLATAQIRMLEMAVTRAGSEPQITMTHNMLPQSNFPPYVVVKHTRDASPSLTGVSEDYVFSTTALPAFAAEVMDNSQVRLTFATDVTAVSGATAVANAFTHPQVVQRPGDALFTSYSARNHPTNTMRPAVYATAVSESLDTRQVTITFGGGAGGGLLTSTPLITYTQSRGGMPPYENTVGSMHNRTFAHATDNAAPVAFAEFADEDTIRVRFSEEMDTPSDSVLGDVAVSAAAGAVAIAGTPAFTAHTAATTSARFGQPALTIELASVAAMDDIHTVSFPGFAAAAGPAGKRAVADATAVRGTPALAFTAETSSLDSITVELNQSVRFAGSAGSLDAANWIVDPDGSDGATNSAADDIAVTAAAFSAAARTVTLTLDAGDARIGDTSKAPYVEYTGTGEIETHAGTALLSGASATAADGAPPAPVGEVTGPREITVTFPEAPDMDPTRAGITWTVTTAAGASTALAQAAGSPSWAAATSTEPAAATLTMVADLDAAAAHTVTIASSASAPIEDDDGNALPFAHTVAVPAPPPTVPMFTAETALIRGDNLIRIEFSEAVTGTTRAGEWFTGVNDDGTGGTAVSALYRRCLAPPAAAQAAMSIDVSAICAADAAVNAIYIQDPTQDTAGTPTVAYRAPSGSGATPIVSADDMTALAGGPVTATDGRAPAFSAATSAADTVVVTFSEAVSLAGGAAAPDASRWHHYESSATPPNAMELAAAVAAMKSFDSASLSADGMTLTLGLASPHEADAASMWDSADPGDTPDTIGYSVPPGMASDLADAAGNGLPDNTADATVTDGAPPAPTGAITGTREVTLTFLEPPTIAPNNSGRFKYSVYAASDMPRSMNLTQNPVMSDSMPGGASSLTYTPETSTAPATLVIPTSADVGPNELVVRIDLEDVQMLTDGTNALPAGHEVPVPAALLFTAETGSQASITVSFATDVSLAGSTTALAASSWIVDPDGSDGATNSATDDIAVTSATFADAANTVTLALDASSANIGDTSKTPYVEYTGTGELESAAGLPLRAGASATATDGAPPEPAGAVTGPSEITVTFPEAPDMDPTRTGITWTVTTAADTATALAQAASSPAWASSAPGEVTLTMAAGLASVAHTVTIASSAAATIEDAAENALAFSLAVPVAAPVAPTFEAETVRIDSTDYIRIDFSAAVTGTTVAGEWFTGVDATDGTGGAAVSVIHRLCATTPLPSLSINVAQVCSGDTEGRPVYLGYSTTDTAARPTVAYRAPSGMSATPILSAAAGLALDGGPVTATDGLAPAFTASTSAANEVVVTFTEAVSLAGGATAPDASRWHHYESSATPPSAAELAAAAAAMKNFDTAALSADGMRLTLGLSAPHEADAASMWDSADPGDTPSTIGYSVPSGAEPDLADAAGNALAPNTTDRPVDDGAPPAPEGSVTGLREITLTFREAPTASPQSNNYIYHAYPGTDSAMNLTASGAAASVTTYVPATATAPARLLIPTNADLGDVAHTVRIDSRNNGQLQDGDANRLAFPHRVRVPVPTAVLFTASVTSLTEIVVTFSRDVSLAGSTTALAASSWIVDPDGSDGATNSAADDITVTAVAFSDAANTATLTLDAADAQIGDTTKAPYVEYTGAGEIESSSGATLDAGASAVAVDNAPPQITGARTGSAGSVGEDAADPADNVYADHIDVTLSEPVSFEDGSTAAQRAARWTVADDEASPQAIAVDDADLVLAMPADTSSRTVRLALDAARSPHALSGSAATPQVSYSAAGATAGRLVLPGTSDPVADAAGVEAADGIGPRLESIPVRGDLTPSTPADDDGAAIVLTFSEDLDPATVGRSESPPPPPPGAVRSGMGVAARLLIDASSPTGFKAPLLDDGACSTGLNWSTATYTVAVDADGNTDLADIVPTADGMGLQRGTQANTIRVASPTSSSDMSQRIFWFCLTPPSSNYDNWLANSAVRDTAGNPYVAVEAPPHGQHVAAADSRAPEFTATVTSATEISVFYDEPVRLKAGASIDASEWRVDTTPNDATDNADGATWLTPSSVSHSFGPMLRPEYYAYGHPRHLEPTDARLGIVLTFAGAAFDPDQGLEEDGSDDRPRVHYTSSGATVDVEDVYGNDAASPASVQSRDSLPPGVTSLVVEVSTASTEGAPVPDRQHARASASSPVAVTFTVTFDEAPDPMQAPILGILADVTESTTVAATSGARDEARVWHMTETAADDGHTWEYTWTVTNMLPGESTPRVWGSGFGLFYGILVQDSDGNALVYTQDGRYPDGSRPQVTLDSAAPAAVSVEMRGRPAGSDAAFTSTVGRPGSEVELHFTVGERDDRLVHAESGSGDATVYAPGLEASAVTFFSGADTTQATSLAGPEVISGVSHYRARATIPAGHADGPIEWAISILDIYGWSASTDSGDVGMTGHPASLGFNVDGTAPEIVAASSHAGVDATGGTRAATDALATSAGAGATVLVDITFNEAIGGTPEVRGTGTRLVLAEDGTGERVAHEFHAAAAMTAVAGSGNTRWQHSWTVPAASSVEHHDSTYRVELLMPMDEAGNTQMTCAGCPGLNDVQVDNVAPSMTGLSFIHGADDAGGRPIPWAAIEYTDHGGLRADGLRAYLNTTSADAALAGAGHLLVKAGDISLSNPGTGAACVAAAATCTTHEGSTVDSRQGLFFRFDYGAGTASATALTDRAGNAASWDQPDPGPHPTSGERFTDPSGFREASARFANADDPLPVVGGVAPASINLGPLGLGPAGEALLFDVAYSPPAAAGASLTLAAGTDAGGLAPASPALALAALPAALAPEYYATIMPADAGEDGAARASLASMGAAAAVDAGRLESPPSPVLLSHPARVTLPGVPGAAAAHVFWISNSHTADASDDRVHSVPECRRSTAAAADAGDVAARAQPDPLDPSTYAAADNAECFVRDARADAIHVWTNHFTPFGASAEMRSEAGGSGCDDCSPPTLGVDSTGARQVVGGFTYNGVAHNVDYYYTPMPLIEVETGVENVAVLKIFEDSGVERLAHAGLAFGLGRGQHFAEAEAEIRVSIGHGGGLSIALDDESGAIDAETLRVDRDVQKCMPGGEADCTVLTIHHTFMEPLEFDVVSTNVWDTRRNAWQNFYNHGVHVDGSSLNPQRGVEVNGGEQVLYPLISARVDDDGDGIYDYDERHVTYMLDEGYGVWRLTPDGTYAPLRNLRALHHDVDDSMYADGRIRTHGAERSSELFAVEVSRQAAIAEAIMAEMGIAVEANEMPVAEPSPYEGMTVEPRLERLSEEIAAEINVAERLIASMLAEPAAAGPAG